MLWHWAGPRKGFLLYRHGFDNLRAREILADYMYLASAPITHQPTSTCTELWKLIIKLIIVGVCEKSCNVQSFRLVKNAKAPPGGGVLNFSQASRATSEFRSDWPPLTLSDSCSNFISRSRPCFLSYANVLKGVLCTMDKDTACQFSSENFEIEISIFFFFYNYWHSASKESCCTGLVPICIQFNTCSDWPSGTAGENGKKKKTG